MSAHSAAMRLPALPISLPQVMTKYAFRLPVKRPRRRKSAKMCGICQPYVGETNTHGRSECRPAGVSFLMYSFAVMRSSPRAAAKRWAT